MLFTKRSEVGVLNQTGDIHIRIIDVQPEIPGDLFFKFDNDTDNSNIFCRSKRLKKVRG